jgi:hypothetical protein
MFNAIAEPMIERTSRGHAQCAHAAYSEDYELPASAPKLRCSQLIAKVGISATKNNSCVKSRNQTCSGYHVTLQATEVLLHRIHV